MMGTHLDQNSENSATKYQRRKKSDHVNKFCRNVLRNYLPYN
jgi:hypothetical protein